MSLPVERLIAGQWHHFVFFSDGMSWAGIPCNVSACGILWIRCPPGVSSPWRPRGPTTYRSPTPWKIERFQWDQSSSFKSHRSARTEACKKAWLRKIQTQTRKVGKRKSLFHPGLVKVAFYAWNVSWEVRMLRTNIQTRVTCGVGKTPVSVPPPPPGGGWGGVGMTKHRRRIKLKVISAATKQRRSITTNRGVGIYGPKGVDACFC